MVIEYLVGGTVIVAVVWLIRGGLTITFGDVIIGSKNKKNDDK